MNKKIYFVALAMVSSIVFGGCSLIAQPASVEEESPDVSLTGTVIQAGTMFSLNMEGKPPVELDSRQVTLSNYVGQTVTVTGQYSGTTLFVSKVQ